MPLPARTQTPSSQPRVEARLGSFTPWIDSQRPLEFHVTVVNTGTVPIVDVEVLLNIYRRVRTRSELHAVLDGRPQQPLLAAIPEELSGEVAPNAEVQRLFSRDLGRLTNTFGKRGTSGVYPIEVQITGAGRKLWSGWSAIVFFSETPKTRLNVTWVLPVHQPAMFEPDGTYPARTVDRALGLNGSTRAMAAAIKKASAIPVTLAPTGLLLDDLSAIADGYDRRDGGRTIKALGTDAVPRGAAETLARLKEALAPSRLEVAATPYSRADLVSLVHSELNDDVAKQVSTGLDRVATHVGRRPNVEIFVPAGLRIDSRAASSLAGLGVRAVVIDPSLLPAQQGIFGPEEPVRVSGRGGVRLDALLADPPIRGLLEGENGGDPVLVAQGVLAETASSWLERPKLADVRALVVTSARTPAATIVATLAAGLASAPWVTVRSASQLLVAVPPKDDPQPLPLGQTSPTPQLTAVKTARRAVEIMRRVVIDPPDATDHLDRLVLAGESADWAVGTHGAALARAAKAQADATIGRIRPAARQVTLTSRTGKLPVTIINGNVNKDGDHRVRVRIRLSSAKVAFPEGAQREVEIGERPETITFPAKARAAGSFGVAVELRTPDGAFPLGGGELVVRSTAVSAVALVVVGGGVLILLAAWLRRGGHRRGGRKTRQPKPDSTTKSGGAAQPA